MIAPSGQHSLGAGGATELDNLVIATTTLKTPPPRAPPTDELLAGTGAKLREDGG